MSSEAGGDSFGAVASELARLLTGGGGEPADGSLSELLFEAEPTPRPLPARPAAVEAWAVDGGQALVADARCLQVYVTRASMVCFRGGACVVEQEGALGVHLMAPGVRPSIDAPLIGPDATVDVALLRDWAEWSTVAMVVEAAAAGSVVLVDGDLVADWRIDPAFCRRVLARADKRGVLAVGVTKHSSLSRGGAPLVGILEREAEETLGRRAPWWAPVARTRSDSAWPDIQVVVARLDPDARFAFRVDLPATWDPEEALGAVASVSDDAAFPGYPYPLSVADRLAACPGWLRQEAWLRLDAELDALGVDPDVRRRAFDDRHRLMERH
ncbi:MAG TPA: DNA double-strand break repair nuclease NurA [Acidimicrobiales bacterium]|nr:DNA double-strand break repair nuclease NurA [Acidimicrobiales bacterium]